MKRRYEQRRRAELQAETRARITDAAVQLHGTVGPARATISAIAALAGVQRATVYRHFPDERALFQACSGRFGAANPPPDPSPWLRISDPEQRLGAALDGLYGWYERVEPMLVNVIRDSASMPILQEIGAGRLEYLAALEKGLSRGWGARGSRARVVRAAVALALDFGTWRTLRARDLDRPEAVALMVALTGRAARRG